MILFVVVIFITRAYLHFLPWIMDRVQEIGIGSFSNDQSSREIQRIVLDDSMFEGEREKKKK